MSYIQKFDSLVSCDSLGGYYGLANFKKSEPTHGFRQYCTSRDCCTVWYNRKWTSKVTGIETVTKSPKHMVDGKLKLKTNLRSKLIDNCPDCGNSLFTEKAKGLVITKNDESQGVKNESKSQSN